MSLFSLGAKPWTLAKLGDVRKSIEGVTLQVAGEQALLLALSVFWYLQIIETESLTDSHSMVQACLISALISSLRTEQHPGTTVQQFTIHPHPRRALRKLRSKEFSDAHEIRVEARCQAIGPRLQPMNAVAIKIGGGPKVATSPEIPGDAFKASGASLRFHRRVASKKSSGALPRDLIVEAPWGWGRGRGRGRGRPQRRGVHVLGPSSASSRSSSEWGRLGSTVAVGDSGKAGRVSGVGAARPRQQQRQRERQQKERPVAA